MQDAVQDWIQSAQYDLETAGHMFKSGRHIYVVFMCHLALEKALKAKVQQVTQKAPPKTHDLKYLIELAGLAPGENMESFLMALSNVSVITRYPQDFQAARKHFTKERARDTLTKTKEAFKWIKDSIKP
jgi:HEPN domain-containing protein